MRRFIKSVFQSSPVSSWVHGRSARNTTLPPRGLRTDPTMDMISRRQKQFKPYLAPGSSSNSAAMGNRSRVNDAIRDGNQGMLRAMLDNNPELIKSHDGDGLTPLSYASYHGYVAMVDFFLQNYPSSVSERNKNKSYPIHKACQGGHIEVLNKMYTYSPTSFTWTDKYGQTILHIAAKGPKNKLKNVVSYLVNLNNQEISKKLIAMKDENLKTPLQFAQDCKNYEVVAIITQRI